MANMKISNWHLPVLFLTLIASYAWALAPGNSGNPVVKSELQKVEATVKAIDYNTREVSVAGPNGPVSFVAGPEVRNLEKVRAGDKVIVSYYQGLAAEMSKDGRHAKEPAATVFASPKEGGKWPGGLVGASITTTVTIEDINPETNTVAVRRSDGTVHIVAVRSPEMQKFARTLKHGDSVDITYTESVAIDVKMAP